MLEPPYKCQSTCIEAVHIFPNHEVSPDDYHNTQYNANAVEMVSLCLAWELEARRLEYSRHRLDLHRQSLCLSANCNYSAIIDTNLDCSETVSPTSDLSFSNCIALHFFPILLKL